MLYQKHGKSYGPSHHAKKKDYFNKKLSMKELSLFLVSNVENKPTSQIYFKKIF